MLTPEQIEDIIVNLIRIYEDVEDELLLNISSRFSVKDEIKAGSLDDWQVKKLDELGGLNEENVRTISKYAGKSQAEIERMLNNAGYQAAAIDDTVFQKAFAAGILKAAPVPVKASQAVKQIMNAAVSNAKNRLNLVNTTALQGAKQDFLDIVNQAYLDTSLGISDYSTSVRRAVTQLADKGVTSITYSSKANRVIKTQTDVAVRRMVLTSTAQIAGEIQLQRAQEWGSNLVEVTSHMGARPSHADWQGKIYSINGGTTEYPNLAYVTGYGTIEGLKGINCRHDFYPFFPGISEQTFTPYDQAENDKAYEESQQQRGLERDIRTQKRRILTAQATDDQDSLDTARAKLKGTRDKLDSFIEQTGRTPRTNRTQVLGFGHPQAAQAARRTIR